MLSPQALFKGLVARSVPQANPDSQQNDVGARLWTYGEQCTQPLVRKAHNLVDEGSYFCLNNGQTGIATAYGGSFSATAPAFVIQNQSTTGQRLYLDYVSLTAIAAGTCTTAVGYIAAALVIDNAIRYSSGGTNLTANIVNPNMAISPGSGASAYFGAVTASAATGAARTIVGIRNIRPGVSSTVINVIGDNIVFNFGGVEMANAGSITVANASLVPVPMPAIVLGPSQSALLYIWYPVMTSPAAATFAPEVGFWVR